MTLASCPECLHSVSSLAVSCPSCGHPIRAQTVEATGKGWKLVVLLGGVLTLGALGLITWQLWQAGWRMPRDQELIMIEAAVLGFGVFVYVVGRLGSWWYHA